MKEMFTNDITINSGETLLAYLKHNRLNIEKVSGITGSDNCIYLPDLTSFNWKSRNGQVRVNCKENVKNIIEQRTGLKLIKNGKGDSTREHSLLIDNPNDLVRVIEALKTISGNMM